MTKQNKIQIILKKLKNLSSAKNIEGMARFGINPKKAFGVSVPNLRKLAKEIRKDPAFAEVSTDAKALVDNKSAGKHKLAQKLWDSGIHEAKILASMIDEVNLVTKKQADQWIKDFDSWDVCDQVCMNLFNKVSFAFEKAIIWTKNKSEFERRAGFALMACLACHDKISSDKKFLKFFPYIKKHSTDNRNFVRKAINWALRQIGKRNINLNKSAIEIAKEMLKIDSKTAKWIASDAIRELSSEAVQLRLKKVVDKK